MLFDTHVHTRISTCSRLTVDDILANARRIGLDGVCITDHQSMEIRRYMKEGVQKDGLVVIFGMEYATSDGDFLIFGSFEDIEPGMSAKKLLSYVKNNNGAAIAAHPFRAARPVNEEIIAQGHCRIVESVNGRNRRRENRRIEKWRERYPLTECGGSDAHSLGELGRAGTVFTTPIYTRGDLVDALNNGWCTFHEGLKNAGRRLNSLQYSPQLPLFI